MLAAGIFFAAAYLNSIDAYPLNTTKRGSSTMDCGSAPFCGVLTLETGDGPNEYHHEDPILHGLWPQVGSYGNSECVVPEGNPNEDASSSMRCYTDADFAQHEWEAHGVCAASSPFSYFTQACALAKSPLSVMSSLKSSGSSLNDMAVALENKGYEVWFVDDYYSQLELVICAGSNKKWKFSSVSQFSQDCGK